MNAAYQWTSNLEQAVERRGPLARIAVAASQEQRATENTGNRL